MAILSVMTTFLKESPTVLGLRLLVELADEWTQLRRNLGAALCSSTKEKTEAKLTVEYHAIEKGLSLGAPRLGFGEKRILTLISDLRKYRDRFSDREFLARPMATVRGYIEFNNQHGHDPKPVRDAFQTFEAELSLPDNAEVKGGVYKVRKDEIAGLGHDFEKFAFSRHSLRDFSGEQVTRDQILKAIRIAQRAPSACNRQGWHAYVFQGEAKNEILRFQGGSNGFTESIGAAIVVVGDLHNFFINEIHQPYVDASLFAMSLMYAFHGQGMGSIPLTTSFKRGKLREFRKRFGIPDHHVPAMIVGVGHLKDEFNVAWSLRKDASEAVTFIADRTP